MLLPDLRIKNYRLFKDFELERLARVNLIAGWNNVGKSSLLEAAYLVATQDYHYALYDVLKHRGWREWFGEMSFGSLFYNYQVSSAFPVEVSSGKTFFRLVKKEQDAWVIEDGTDKVIDAVPRDKGEQRQIQDAFSPPQTRLLTGGASLADHFGEMATLWESLLLTSDEAQVVEALRLLEPQVERLAFTRRDIRVRLAGSERPVWIGDLGEGIQHLLMIVLLLVASKHKVVLIDEIDTGLHYTVLIDLWRLVFQTAKRLNVQVLATTHSWDCITAFSQAWNEVEESEGLFFRLSRKGDKIKPVVYSAERLNIAAEQGIEVR